MRAQTDRIRVFISSRMEGLQDLRATLHRELEKLGIDAFVYEVNQGAHPDDPETVSLFEVERTDVLVLIIGDSYGEVTEREYDKARELNKPCLVYERLGRRETSRELRRFLDKLSGPRGVPSRAVFQNAVDLAEKVAEDVRAWLVREYRRLSAAAQSAAGESSRRTGQLQSDMRRLAASTSRPLPSGNPSDLLAWQLRQWFEALEYPLEREPETGPDYTDLVVSVRERRDYKRMFVRAIAGEIQSPDVEAARRDTEGGAWDEVWLVSLRRVSPAAREAATGAAVRMHLYTLDQLIEEDVNFDRYFEWLDAQVEAADIDRLYVTPAVTVNEVDASGVLRSASTYDDIAAYVDQWLEDSDGEHLSLLGEFGTGKSWFALKYAHDMVGRYREAQRRGLTRPRVPLVIQLRDYARGFKDVASLLTDFVLREHQIRIPFAAIGTLNRMGRLLFIFDGFDEMASRVDQQKMVDNFWSLASVLGPGSKAILTCRTEYFHFARQAREVLGGHLRGSSMKDLFETARFQVATLQMFDEPRLRAVLSRRTQDEGLVEAVMSNQRLIDLGSRPVMIDLLIEAMPYLGAEGADLARVYYQAVKRKMERDISLGRTFTSLADKIFFMCEVSWEMISTRQLKINYKQLPERVRAYFGSRADSVEEDHWRHDLLSQTMLVRDDDGYYHPAHKSLIEFFSAYKLSAALGALRDEYVEAARSRAGVREGLKPARQRWSEYFRGADGGQALAPLERFARESPDELKQTWGQLTLDDATSEMILLLCGKEVLCDYVKGQDSSEEVESVVAARALEVAAFSGDLRGADLSGVSLSGCYLSSCDLGGADLSGSAWDVCTLNLVTLDGASLRDAEFRDVIFTDVTFRGADLSNARFEDGADFLVSVAGIVWCTRGDEEILLVVLADGRLVAFHPRAQSMGALARPAESAGRIGEEFAGWLLELKGDLDLPGLGRGFFTRSGWHRDRPWLGQEFDEGLDVMLATTSHAHGDVEALEIKVMSEVTEEELLTHKVFDATDLGSSGTRVMALSKSGKHIAAIVVAARKFPETAVIRSQPEASEVPLRGFMGGTFSPGPETTDNRGAAFSPSASLLAVCERPNVVGVWLVGNGEFVGRVVFHTAASGCVVEGAEGLPPEFVTSNSDGRDGWVFEPPS